MGLFKDVKCSWARGEILCQYHELTLSMKNDAKFDLLSLQRPPLTQKILKIEIALDFLNNCRQKKPNPSFFPVFLKLF